MRETLDELKKRIQERIALMSESQKLIADFIVENPEKFALSSIRELEKDLKTSKSTIVRFAQFLGYEGFHELKNEFLKIIRRDLDPINRYKTFLSEPASQSNYINLLAKEAVDNINTTMHLIDQNQYSLAIKLLKNASNVYTMGLGISSYLAQIAAYLFNHVSINADCMTFGGLTFFEQTITLNKGDVIMVFSFPKYSQETIEAAELAKKRGIKVIAVTDKVTADIIPFSDAHLQVAVETRSVSNCINAVLVLLSAMTTQIGHELKEKTLEMIESIDHARKGRI